MNRPEGDSEHVPEPEEMVSSNNMTFGKPVSSSMHISSQPQVINPPPQILQASTPPKNLAH